MRRLEITDCKRYNCRGLEVIHLVCWNWHSLSYVKDDQYLLNKFHPGSLNGENKFWMLNGVEATKILLFKPHYHRYALYHQVSASYRYLLPRELVIELVVQELVSCDT